MVDLLFTCVYPHSLFPQSIAKILSTLSSFWISVFILLASSIFYYLVQEPLYTSSTLFIQGLCPLLVILKNNSKLIISIFKSPLVCQVQNHLPDFAGHVWSGPNSLSSVISLFHSSLQVWTSPRQGLLTCHSFHLEHDTPYKRGIKWSVSCKCLDLSGGRGWHTQCWERSDVAHWHLIPFPPFGVFLYNP